MKIMSSRIVLGLAIASALGAAGVGFAQERGTVSAGQFTGTLQSNNRALESITGLYGQIASAKNDNEKDKLAAGLERNFASYAKAMVAAMNTALEQAQLSLRSEGKQGSLDLLRTFEDQAKAHETQLKTLNDRAQKMKPKDGMLTVPAPRWAFTWPKVLSGIFVTSAEAAIAAGVYAGCHQQPPNQSACTQAVANGVAQTAAAHSAFNSCWDSFANRKPAWWRALLRGSCVAALVSRLA